MAGGASGRVPLIKCIAGIELIVNRMELPETENTGLKDDKTRPIHKQNLLAHNLQKAQL